MLRTLILTLVAAVCGCGVVSPAWAQTWDGGGANDNWSTPSNWSLELAPAKNGTADVVFGGTTRLTPFTDGSWGINSLSFNNTAGAFTIGGSTLTLGAGGITNNDGDAQTLNNDIILASSQTWTATNGPLSLNGQISLINHVLSFNATGGTSIINGSMGGDGTFVKLGNNTLILGGATDNFNLALHANAGSVILAKTSNTFVHAVGGGGLNINGAAVLLGGSGDDQIYDFANVSVNSGSFDTNGRSETFNTLNLAGAGIGGVGALLNSAPAASTINAGSIVLTGNTVIGVTQSTGSLTIASGISGDFSVTKVGAGTLNLGSNTFTGGLTLSAGTLVMGSDISGGSGRLTLNGGTLSKQSGFFRLRTPVSIGGNVTIDSGPAGSFAFSSAVTLTADSVITTLGAERILLEFLGQDIPGRSLTKQGAGTLLHDFHGLDQYGQLGRRGRPDSHRQRHRPGQSEHPHPLWRHHRRSRLCHQRRHDLVSEPSPATAASSTSASSTSAAVIGKNSANANSGNISIPAGVQMRLTGQTLNNTGTIALNGSMVGGSAQLTNASGGTITGNGLISAPFANSGGTILVREGTLNFSTTSWTNGGLVRLLDGAGISGGTITNNGSIRGDGSISAPVTNRATIEAEGTLALGGLFTNSSLGLITAGPDSEVIVIQSMGTNDGIINLKGGSFSTNGWGLTNSGQISGFGTFAASPLNNNGTITFTGGFTTINGNVTNAAGKQLRVAHDAALFTGNVTNNGIIKNTEATITFAGTYTENGTFISDPADNFFSDVNIGADGAWVGGHGDRFLIGGDLLSSSTNKTGWQTTAAELNFIAGADHILSVNGADLGPTFDGYIDNFAWGTLAIAAGDDLELIDGNGAIGGAIYVQKLLLGGHLSQITAINSNGLSIYYHLADPANAYLGGRTYALSGGGSIAPVPEPAAVALLLLGLIASAARRRHRR